MSRVLKYQIREGPIELPVGAKVVCVAMQRNEPCLWALVSAPGTVTESREFKVVGTGSSNIDDTDLYVGTIFDGPFVWHIFEVNK